MITKADGDRRVSFPWLAFRIQFVPGLLGAVFLGGTTTIGMYGFPAVSLRTSATIGGLVALLVVLLHAGLGVWVAWKVRVAQRAWEQKRDT